MVIAGDRARRAARPPGAAALHLHRRRHRFRPAAAAAAARSSARTINGARIWIRLGPFSLPARRGRQDRAGHLLRRLPRADPRRAVASPGARCSASTCPRGRDLGPILVAWLVSLAVLVFERDLGSSLLFFGLFVAMLYVATERRVAGSSSAWPCSAPAPTSPTWSSATCRPACCSGSTRSARRRCRPSDQLAKGLIGMASGGMFGTGLGRGRPDLTYFAESDFIIPRSARSSG